MTLHPELRVRQIKDFVADYNNQIKESLTKKQFDSTKKAQDSLFLLNVDVLGALYVHPLIGAHSFDDWAKLINNYSIGDTSKAEYKDALEVFKSMAEYNFVNVDDDLPLLLAVPVDYDAISQQFHVYGREHGWAYRACRPEEAANTPRSSLPIEKAQTVAATSAASFIPDTGLYCRDAAGIDRLIR
jgi:hypothetical protein